MGTEMVKLAIAHGLWAVLSIFLILYVLQVQKVRDKNQDERESNYISIIKDLTNKMDVLTSINETVNELKENMNEMKKNS